MVAATATAPAAGGEDGREEARFYHGAQNDRKAGGLLFKIRDGIVGDIAFAGFSRCRYEGRQVKPVFGVGLSTPIPKTELNRLGGFRVREPQRFGGPGMRFDYEVTATPRGRGFRASVTIEYDQPLKREAVGRRVHCSTRGAQVTARPVTKEEWSEQLNNSISVFG